MNIMNIHSTPMNTVLSRIQGHALICEYALIFEFKSMPLYANHFTFWREESINSVIRAPVARATHRTCVSSFPIMSEREVVYIDYVVDVLDIGAEVIIDEGDANGTNDLSNQGDTDTGTV